ncbi:MAG: cell division protein FtsQ/DivIB [Alphaproteobacteria bacterium]|jgi:cell division protein FtsQ|nr:cell division protein FtsQ/DivIB [Alphaproteobacteria bacterium]
MKKSIWFWLCFVIAIVFAVYFSVRIAMTGMGHGNSAYVNNISITADQSDKDLTAIVAAATITPNTRSYSVDLDMLNKRVANVPGVKKSAVRRMPNGNISVKVALYRAVALWTDGQNYFPLSDDGTIINKPAEVRDESHVVFRGKLPEDISDITNAAHNLVGNLDYIEWIENRRWNMYTNDGILIMLPEENPTAAIGTLLSLDNTYNLLGKDIKMIDMRDSARILIK